MATYACRRTLIPTSCIGLLMLLILPTVQAADLPVLHWCLDHFPRFHEFSGRKPPEGPSVAVMQELAKRVGFKLQFSPRTPIARCFRQMATGEADLMSNLNRTPERAGFMHMFPYSERVPESLYLRGNDRRFIDQLSQLDPLTLVTVRNYAYHPTLMALIRSKGDQHIEVDSIAAGFELLNKGRVDGLIAPTFSSLDVIRHAPHLRKQFRRAKLSFQLPQTEYIYIAMSKQSKHVKLQQQIQQTVAQMMADGTVARLYNLTQTDTNDLLLP